MQEIRLKPSELEWREVDGEVIVLEAERSLYMAANPAAALLWQLLADGTTRKRLCEALVDAYGIDEGLASRDVGAFIEQARELRVVDGP